MIVFGDIAAGGGSLFRTYVVTWSKIETQRIVFSSLVCQDVSTCNLDTTTGLIRTLIRFLQELHRRFGRIAVITDNAPQHTGARVRRYIKENPDIRAITLPVATLELNATEYWHQLKQDVAVSTHSEDADT